VWDIGTSKCAAALKVTCFVCFSFFFLFFHCLLFVGPLQNCVVGVVQRQRRGAGEWRRRRACRALGRGLGAAGLGTVGSSALCCCRRRSHLSAAHLANCERSRHCRRLCHQKDACFLCQVFAPQLSLCCWSRPIKNKEKILFLQTLIC
jgi:hypothetical protein